MIKWRSIIKDIGILRSGKEMEDDRGSRHGST
jgi:hypothetical protein